MIGKPPILKKTVSDWLFKILVYSLAAVIVFQLCRILLAISIPVLGLTHFALSTFETTTNDSAIVVSSPTPQEYLLEGADTPTTNFWGHGSGSFSGSPLTAGPKPIHVVQFPHGTFSSFLVTRTNGHGALAIQIVERNKTVCVATLPADKQSVMLKNRKGCWTFVAQ